jgi:aquaporin Z
MAMMRKFAAELLGTTLLVFFGVGAATLMFGFKFDGGSVAAGIVATALTFGLILLALAYVLGPVSGCHVNPAVTIGALLARRLPLVEAVGYWVAQFAGGILGAPAVGRVQHLAGVQHVQDRARDRRLGRGL